MNNLNQERIKMTKMEEMFNTIKLGNPVKVFYFNNEKMPQASSSGMYLLMYMIKQDKSELEKILKSKVVMDDITGDDQLLMFDKRHIYEICGILYPIFKFLCDGLDKLREEYDEKRVIKCIFNMTNNCLSYKEFKEQISYMLTAYKKYLPDYAYDGLKIIMDYIWFIPYNGLNDLFNEAADLYQKEMKVKEQKENESNN